MCDSVVVSPPFTALGSTLFAKNSDRHSGECQPFLQFPAAYHPRGSKIRCTHIEIPQVAETYRVVGHSPHWVWGFEHGVNEYAVAIGNMSVFSKEPVEEEPGLIGMDLVRLGLERGRNAREALEVIAGLIERHGQGGSGFGPGEAGYHNSFMIADAEQSWLMETSGRRWAARRVDLEAASNHISLDSNWGIASRDLESFARVQGWWRGRDRVDFERAYRNVDMPRCISEPRQSRARLLLEAGRGKHDFETMRALLRDHGGMGSQSPLDAAPNENARYTLCMHAEPVGSTTASLIVALPTDRSGPWPIWISFGSPCLGVFIPIYLEGVLPAALARGDGDGPSPEGASAWWRFHRLRELAEVDLLERSAWLRDAWRETEAGIESSRHAIEAQARSLIAAGERVEAVGLLSDFMSSTVEQVLADADRLYHALGELSA